MSPDLLIKVDLDGNIRGGYLKPSSEIKITSRHTASATT